MDKSKRIGSNKKKQECVTITIKSTEKSELENMEMEEARIDLQSMEVTIRFKRVTSGESNHFFLRELKKYLTTYSMSNIDKIALLYSVVLGIDHGEIYKKLTSDPSLLNIITDHLSERTDDRGLYIIKRRFGIGMLRRYSLPEVAKAYSVTRERIRQIEVKVIRNLKNPDKLKKILSYFDNQTTPTKDDDGRK